VNDFPIDAVRQQFPALHQTPDFIFLDNAAGAQAPDSVLRAVQEHLLMRNVQRGGRYKKSREVDAAIAAARESVAVFLNARTANEVSFGMNATSFIRMVSLAIGDTLKHRKEIVVTDLDHEANIATWLLLERQGAVIRWWNVREDGRLYTEDLHPLLSERTRLVACTVASNAIGTIVDVTSVATLAHAVGAEVFLDAVHYGPHGIFDVQAWGCDYLVCSGYKIFAPHMGFLWGRQDALDALPTFREDFIPDKAPWKLEAGTYVYENVRGMDAAVRYLEGVAGTAHGGLQLRRDLLVESMRRIQEYEATLSRRTLAGLTQIPGVTVYGVADVAQVGRRVPTFCFTMEGVPPAEVAEKLADRNIGVRDGNMYSPRLMRRFRLGELGGVRASIVHYNTNEEVDRFLAEIESIGSRKSSSSSFGAMREVLNR